MSEPEFVPGFGDIGARLRAARERSGMSIAQVAERMHCDRGLVESLEAGRFTQLGAPVFARGHIRRYAELLGEPVGELLERWDRESAGHVAAPDLTRIPQARRVPNTRRLLWPLGIVALIALFAVVIPWVLRDAPLPDIGSLASAPAPAASPPPAAPAEPAAAAAVTDAGVAVPAAPAASTPATTGAVAPGTTTPAAAAPAARPANALAGAAPTTAAAARPAATSAAQQLSLRARSDCWVEIYDAAGKRLYFNLLAAGSGTSVRGPAPLRLLLGNVGGVSIDLNGRPLELPRAVRRANTANVLVAADGSVSAAPRD